MAMYWGIKMVVVSYVCLFVLGFLGYMWETEDPQSSTKRNYAIAAFGVLMFTALAFVAGFYNTARRLGRFVPESFIKKH
jgi:hypothetical protein